MQRLIARPVMASQETMDVLGKLTEDVDDLNTVDINDGSDDKAYQDMSSITDTIIADQNTAVPERGVDFADVAQVSDEFREWASEQGSERVANKITRVRAQFGIDAMPPNGEEYTQGDKFPDNPKDCDWHRLTYTEIRSGISARLYRYSGIKKRWIFMEKDRRAESKDTKPKLQKALDPNTSTVTPVDDKTGFYDNKN